MFCVNYKLPNFPLLFRVMGTKISPVLFEFQNAQYLSTGKVIGKCRNYGKDFA